VAEVLTGAYNPSGRLTMSVPRHEGQLPVYYNHFRTGRPYKNKVWFESKYIDLDPTPTYPFGYGLSYTRFVYENLSLSAKEMSSEGSIRVMFDIHNTGSTDGFAVPQLYVRDLVGCCVRPVKELKGFSKLLVKAGESVQAELVLRAKDLAFCDPNGNMIVEPGKFHLWVGQNALDETLFAEFSVYKT
jgi:beta-glucosidase